MDESVIEVFHRVVVGSRKPLLWAGVQLQPKQGDQIHVNVRGSQDPTGPFYTDPILESGAFTFDVPASEEPRLRKFFDEGTGRPTHTSG